MTNHRPLLGHRRFQLHRATDHTGVTGTGLVAEGVAFSDGTAAVRWLSDHASTVVWSSLDDAMRIHCHGGHTTIAWIDH